MRDACFWWIHFVWSTLVLRLHPNNQPQILADWASSDSNAFSFPSFQKYFPIYFVLAHFSPWTHTSDMPNAAAHFFFFFFHFTVGVLIKISAPTVIPFACRLFTQATFSFRLPNFTASLPPCTVSSLPSLSYIHQFTWFPLNMKVWGIILDHVSPPPFSSFEFAIHILKF